MQMHTKMHMHVEKGLERNNTKLFNRPWDGVWGF
jgi:hypothetical protein